MLGESQSLDILHRALRAAGADEADACLVSTDRNISRFANSVLHQNMSEVSAGLTLRVVVNGSMGVASTSVFDDDELERIAAVAREAAKHSNPLPGFTGLHRSGGEIPPLETVDAAASALTPAAKAERLRSMFDAGRKVGAHFAGSYTTAFSSVATANTHRLERFTTLTWADATAIAIAGDASGYATTCSRHDRDVSLQELGDEALFRALLCRDTVEDIEPGAFDVVVEPPAMAEVFDWMGMIAFTGQSFEDGSSFLVGNRDKQITGTNFTVADDATEPDFLPFPFDMEGMAKRRIPLIEAGVAKLPMVDKAYADRLGIAPNGGAWSLGSPDHGVPMHISIAAGEATRDELIESTELGIWVTRFNYVNGLLEPRTARMTGTTRDGTFLIRNGRVVARLPNLRWTESILEALSSIEASTRDRKRVSTWYNMFGGTIAPAMKIRNWHFTGKQDTRTA